MHKYYLSLDDEQKRQVWNEFYQKNTIDGRKVDHPKEFETIIREEDNDDYLKKKRKPKKPLTKRRHLVKSMFLTKYRDFVYSYFLIWIFNEVFIAPFITPSKNLSVDSIIVSNATVDVSPNPVIIIPKINVEIPVVYTVPTLNESAI